MTPLERALAAAPQPPADVLARVRATVAAEQARPRPTRGWLVDGLAVGATAAAVALLVGGALGATGQLSGTLANAPAVGLLLGCAALSSVAALVPGRRWSRWLALGWSGATAVALVALRLSGGTPSPLPEWVCTASHLAAALPGALLALRALREVAPSPLRATVLGAAAGTTGALVGELGCGQGAAHVALFHLSAWAVVAAVVALAARSLERRSYAP